MVMSVCRLIYNSLHPSLGFPFGLAVKTLPAMQEVGFNFWVEKIPQRRAWQPTPVFLPGESHAQRSLVGYSPWGHKESDTTEQLNDKNDDTTGFPGGLDSKESACNTGDPGSSPGLGRSPGEENNN